MGLYSAMGHIDVVTEYHAFVNHADARTKSLCATAAILDKAGRR
jgi:hypothetical protein